MPRATRGSKASATPSPKKPRFTQNPPERFHTNTRMSEAVVFNNVVYLAGQVADNADADIKGQTEQVLASIEKLLVECNSDKTKIIRAEIFIKNLEDFAGMNEVWEAWIGKYGPARATVQANLVNPKWLVEIVVTAACSKDYPEDEEEDANAE